MRHLPQILLLASLAFGCASSQTWSAEPTLLARSTEALENLQRYEDQLADLESQFGPFDMRLLEPMESMIRVQEELGDFEEVAEIQQRQLAVMRSALGFEHPDLIPMVRSIIANQIKLGNWEEISEQLEHIRFLIASSEESESDELLQAIENQAQWYLARLIVDRDRSQSRNFMDARDLYRELERAAEDIYGEESPEIAPWYYKRAFNIYQLVQLLNTDDGLSGSTIDEVIRRDGRARLEQGNRVFGVHFGLDRNSPVMVGDQQLGHGYLRRGQNFINRIRDIAEEQSDLEMLAMANLYYGDFQVLMERGSGRKEYTKARELLLEVGIPQEEIDRLFLRPMQIPMQDFYSRFDELLAVQQENLALLQQDPLDPKHLGVFTAWEEALPATARPIPEDSLLQMEFPHEEVEVGFRINSNGATASVETLSEDRRVRREATRALREMRFRPYFSEGRPRRISDVKILYRYIVEDD